MRGNNLLNVQKDCLWEVCILLRQFAHTYNASIQFVTQRSDNVTIDLSRGASNDSNLTNVKYFQYNSVSLIIPWKLDKSKYVYYFLPFTCKVWVIYFITICIFATLSIASFNLKGIQSLVTLAVIQFTHTVQLITSQPYQIKKKNLVQLSGSFFGTIMGWMYCSILGSLLTTNIEDSKFKIICDQ